MKKKKPKIAIFHCGFVYSGGGERIVLEEAKGLKKRGHEVLVYAPTIDKKACYPDFLEELGVKTFLPSFTEKLPFRDALRMVISSLLAPILALNFRDVDVFFGANQPSAWMAYCMAKILRKPYLVYLNQPNRLVYPREIDQKTGWQTRKDYYLLAGIIKKIKPFIAWTDRISFTSGATMLVNGSYIGNVIKKIYQKPVVSCPGGAYPQAWSSLRLNPESAFEGEFKINGFKITKPFILITNRHEPQKKFEYVIEAMEKVVKKVPEATLVIPGPFTSHTSKLINLSKHLKVDKKVLFLGQISEKDLQKLYQEAAVYCYPAPDEDFGLGPLEAGAWGMPTVAWNHGGPTVTVIHGKTGYLAKPYQIEDYAQGIVALLSSPQKRAEMGKAAWEQVRKNFSWERHVDILEREIKKVIK
ncbi:glycosyltransferase family 4 protein [Patescibacteria group bacterium]|nr:glycosyltransferase family 4 protein [Patescibacteria group bacterium]